jgi:hypothetical protein
MKAINSSFLAPNIIGRVDITRTFEGQELNTEYLFGLFATLGQNSSFYNLLGYPTGYVVTHFTARGNVAASANVIMFNFTSIGISMPIEIDTWTVYNAYGQVEMYDFTFRYFSWLYDTFFEIIQNQINALTHEQTIFWITDRLATSICSTHQMYCNGANQQYASYDACDQFLRSQIRFGKAYEMGRNTLLCRMLHQNMVQYRPTVHCPHIGPSGGGMCEDDSTYLKTVLDPTFLSAPFIS